jgi:ligand-binding sensor domain-containing protein
MHRIARCRISKGCPTEEVYDIFSDSKGFVWVGHSLGLSRYDGRTFRHFNSTEQTGLGVSRLCEDRQGRIWCHNFNGQIFYTEQEQMHLLKDYDPSLETSFPDITVLDSEFIATSARGLFVCNTYTMKSRFLYTPGIRTAPRPWALSAAA